MVPRVLTLFKSISPPCFKVSEEFSKPKPEVRLEGTRADLSTKVLESTGLDGKVFLLRQS